MCGGKRVGMRNKIISLYLIYCHSYVEGQICQLGWYARTDPSEGPRGPEPPWVQMFFSYFIFHFCSWVSLLPIQSSYPNSNTNYPTQKLNKNNKNIHNGDCILAKKQFYHQITKKKSCVIGEVKTKFFATTVNWYKWELAVASC